MKGVQGLKFNVQGKKSWQLQLAVLRFMVQCSTFKVQCPEIEVGKEGSALS